MIYIVQWFPVFQMILTVFLSNNEQILTEVPITPETTCRDVVEFCKEPGEGSCHLSEVWRGNGKQYFGLPYLSLLHYVKHYHLSTDFQQQFKRNITL